MTFLTTERDRVQDFVWNRASADIFTQLLCDLLAEGSGEPSEPERWDSGSLTSSARNQALCPGKMSQLTLMIQRGKFPGSPQKEPSAPPRTRYFSVQCLNNEACSSKGFWKISAGSPVWPEALADQGCPFCKSVKPQTSFFFFQLPELVLTSVL